MKKQESASKTLSDPQGLKFQALAKALECDESEAAFDEKLRKIVKKPGPQKTARAK